jgi:hypothetical protein
VLCAVRSCSALSRVELRHLGKLLEQFSLLVGKMLRDGDPHDRVEIAVAAALLRQAAAA